MVGGGAGPRVMTQGPVDLPEHHVREVGIERALVGAPPPHLCGRAAE